MKHAIITIGLALGLISALARSRTAAGTGTRPRRAAAG